MPFIFPGVYSDSGEKAYEKESCYYIEFQIVSSLVSIEYLLKQPIDDSLFSNKCQYYHYYCDHLIYSIGQIANRFLINEKKDKGINLERKYMNIQNFFFDVNEYPILSNKNARNMVEHIDEYNNRIILQEHGVGGFNVIDEETEQEIIDAVNNKNHIYTLDITKRDILVVKDKKRIAINLDELKVELLNLKKSVSDLLSMISNI